MLETGAYYQFFTLLSTNDGTKNRKTNKDKEVEKKRKNFQINSFNFSKFGLLIPQRLTGKIFSTSFVSSI